MKRIICTLLALLCFALPALAEGALLAEGAPRAAEATPFAPYALTTPEAVELTENEGTYTFVYGVTRVVAMVIERVPDEDPGEAIIRMMAQFEPDAVIGEDIPMAEGFVGLNALHTDKFGEGIDQLTVMVLSSEGDLLILSGYDLAGDETRLKALMDALLASLTADGVAIAAEQE